MYENETHKLIGKLSGAIVFLSLIVLGLIFAILVLFAFQESKGERVEKADLMICGTPFLNLNYGIPSFKTGEQLFKQNCASCHFPDKDMTGPALKGSRERGWENAYERWIYDYIRNEDSLVQVADTYSLKLRDAWNWSDHGWSHNFSLTDSEIDDLMGYVN